MKRTFVYFSLSIILSGCAQLRDQIGSQDSAPTASNERIALFSENPAGGLPKQWDPLILFRTKKQTAYQLVNDQNKTVLHSRAEGSSSGLMQYVNIDPFRQPWLSWDWKIGNAIDTVDDTKHTTEDSPGRVILGFDGDKDNLSFADQILFETARVFTGYEFPYATLMYIWDSKAPIGTVMTSNRSGRIKMLVVANASEGVGQWRNFKRNIVADFEKAYGEKPGKLIGVGVLTDTDTSGETAETWYGDLQLLRDAN
ncbi:DUF3047 domain-containing protein [soil metagenome]